MAKGKDEQITDMNVSWEGYAGKRIEEFIKNTFGTKVGYLYVTHEDGTNNNYHLCGFASEESYNEWNNDPENNAHLLLIDIPLPKSDDGAVKGPVKVIDYDEETKTLYI